MGITCPWLDFDSMWGIEKSWIFFLNSKPINMWNILTIEF